MIVEYLEAVVRALTANPAALVYPVGLLALVVGLVWTGRR